MTDDREIKESSVMFNMHTRNLATLKDLSRISEDQLQWSKLVYKFQSICNFWIAIKAILYQSCKKIDEFFLKASDFVISEAIRDIDPNSFGEHS